MDYVQDYLSFFKSIVDETKDLSLYKDAMDYIDEQFGNYSISDKDKAELTIHFMSSVTNSVINSAMQIALTGLNAKQKLEKEISMIDKELLAKDLQNDILQITKSKEQAKLDVLDKEISMMDKELLAKDLQNQKLEEDILNLQATNQLLASQKASQDIQTLLIEAEKNYKMTQEQMVTIANNDNKLIKALDSTSDMIGTIGAGGLAIPQQLIQNYFEMVNALLGTTLVGGINVGSKAV